MREVPQIPELPNTWWAWLAGFIDGDGCIGIYIDGEGYKRPTVMIAQKDRMVLDFIKDTMKTGCVHTAGKTTAGNPMHQLVFGSLVSRVVAEKIYPYLWIKKQQAEDLINHRLKEGVYRSNSSFNNPNLPDALERYKNGESIYALTHSTGISGGTLMKWVKQMGLTRSLSQAQLLRRQRERATKVIPPKIDKKSVSTKPEYSMVIELYKQGLSAKEISLKTGVNARTVWYWAKHAGINRTIKESQILRFKK